VRDCKIREDDNAILINEATNAQFTYNDGNYSTHPHDRKHLIQNSFPERHAAVQRQYLARGSSWRKYRVNGVYLRNALCRMFYFGLTDSGALPSGRKMQPHQRFEREGVG
jgi:hypothetical protein